MSEVSSVLSLGDWNLSRLGVVGAFDLPSGAGRQSRSLEFSLPKGVRQGPETWYLGRLHVEVQVARRTRSGIVYITASTNGRAAQKVKLEVTRKPGREPRIAWSSLDLIVGIQRGTVRGQTVRVNTQNYLQNQGVQPGPNVLTFAVEPIGHMKVQRVSVLPDSGLTVSDLSPAHLVLDESFPSESVAAGQSFDVGYTLRNDGDRATTEVGVGLESSSNALAVVGETRRSIGMLAAGEHTSGSFRVHARTAGGFRLILTAGALNANNPSTEIAVPVHA